MTTPEAPTPDEVDTMMSDIGSLARVPFQVNRGLETAKKLRAHIAALEAAVENGKESCRAMASCLDRRDDRITELEAENKRLAAELDFTAHRMKHEADERDKADEQNKRLVAWLKRAEKELEKGGV